MGMFMKLLELVDVLIVSSFSQEINEKFKIYLHILNFEINVSDIINLLPPSKFVLPKNYLPHPKPIISQVWLVIGLVGNSFKDYLSLCKLLCGDRNIYFS